MQDLTRRLSALIVAGAVALALVGCDSKSHHSSNDCVRDAFDICYGFSYPVWTVAPAADASGDIYVGGQFAYFDGYWVNGIVRLNANGTIDPGFNMGSGFNGTVLDIRPATDGSGDIYVGGLFTYYQGVPANRLIRLNADGSIDTAFNIGTGFDDAVYVIEEAKDGSGDIYTGGEFSQYNGNSSVRVARINSDGSYDAGFSVGAGPGDVVKSLAVVPSMGSDTIYIGGDFSFVGATPANRIARLLDNGNIDGGFAIGAGFDDNVETLAPAADGSGDIYVGGRFLNFDGNPSARVARINSDGSFDAGFATSTGFNNTVYDIEMDTGTPGQLFAVGAFTTFDGISHRGIACLNSVGFICSGFSSGSGFSYVALTAVFANDGSGDLFVGGAYLYYNNRLHYRLVRLNPAGIAL